MNSKNTCLWITAAAALFAFIFFFERHLHKPPAGPARILPGLKTSAVTGVQILPKGELEIRVERTNDTWQLSRPFSYPAQSDLVDRLLAAVDSLAPATCITAQELKNDRQADRKYGFEPPQKTLVIQSGEEQSFIHIGYKTAPGDQIFLQVVGVGDVYVVDADWLNLIPGGANEWRTRAFVDLNRPAFDRLVVTCAGKPFELQLDPTNHLWRMFLPGWEPRADSDRVEEALQRLQELRVEQFVSDDPKADLDTFGLQTPELSLALERGTNTVRHLEFGRSPTNDASLVYARRIGLNSVVTVSKDILAPWRAPLETFRDRHLVRLAAPLEAIEVRAQDNFTLQRQTDSSWRVLPQDFRADSTLVAEFITNLSRLQVTGFPKDVVTTPDLPTWGLDAPTRQFILKTAPANAAAGPTNGVVVQLDFGTNQDDKIFARRGDESSLYTVKVGDVELLPSASWQMRERRVWNFSEEDAIRITIHQEGKTREFVRKGTNSWSFAPGSQGIMDEVVAAALQETVHRLGGLAAARWVENSDRNRDRYGFTPGNQQVALELKDGRKLSVEFGGVDSSGFPCALAEIDGHPWIFEFPLQLYELVRTYLTIPPYIH